MLLTLGLSALVFLVSLYRGMAWLLRRASSNDNGKGSLTPAEKLRGYYDLAKVRMSTKNASLIAQFQKVENIMHNMTPMQPRNGQQVCTGSTAHAFSRARAFSSTVA